MKSVMHRMKAAVAALALSALIAPAALGETRGYDVNLTMFKPGTGGPAGGSQLAADGKPAGDKPDDGLSKEQKALLLNAGAVAAIATYGLVKWDYFQTSIKFTPEGWFDRETKSGGADKLGHFWSTYAASNALAYIYREWGFSDVKANGFGALSALGIQTMMELGDAYSGDYGFSYEDLVMNISGAAAAFLLRQYPELDRKIDLRVEYTPDSVGDLTGDVFSDYENQRYLIALKLDGFDTFHDTPLSWLELHFGYYTRGYEAFARGEGDARRRSVYFGLGLNVTKVVQRLTDSDFALFDYIQVPYTSVRTSHHID